MAKLLHIDESEMWSQYAELQKAPTPAYKPKPSIVPVLVLVGMFALLGFMFWLEASQ